MCATCVCGTGVMGFLRAHLFASMYVCSLPWMPECACTICILILCWNQVRKCTIEAMRILSRWLYWEDNISIWLFMKYILLWLFVNVCRPCGVFCVFAKANQMAYNSTHMIVYGFVVWLIL